MVEDDLTPAQILLLRARATRFVNFKQQNILSAEHGLLIKEIDPCLAFGLLKHGYDEDLPANLSASVFVPYNKCLTLCMQNGVQRNKEFCEVCDSISDLTKHSSLCMGHPEACPTCKTFFNLLEYHLLKCYTCDMHLCTKLKLKLLKYQNSVIGGLVELWPKIQQYISRLFPASEYDVECSKCTSMSHQNKQGLYRYPSTFDSGTPPVSPGLVARGPDQGKGHTHHTPGDAARYGASASRYDEYQKDMGAIYKIVGETINAQNPPLHNFQYGAAAAYDPAAAGDHMEVSTDLSSLTLNSFDTKLKINEGFGSIIMGEPRQLRKLAEHWTTLKRRVEDSSSGQLNFRTECDGVILTGKSSGMKSVSGQYKKNEQWRKITYVGSGVAGKCYLAVDINSEAQFAVKRIDLLKYQAEELELWSELEHPNLVQLYGAMRVKKKVYIFSEFYAAGNMAEFIDGHRMLDQWLSIWFLSQLLDALVYLKRKEILHEDIKADNIFLKPDSFKLGLGDFGLSRKGRCPPNVKPVGGQHQWSPEKARSEGHGYPADIWAVNCTFIHMLSGDPPWRKRFSEICFLHYKIANDSPPLEDIPANLLTVVDSLVRDAYTLNPADRPSAEDLQKHECFELLYGQYNDAEPLFRSHIPAMGEEEMEFEGYDERDSLLSIDSLLEGMEDKQNAIDYINHLCSTLDEDPESAMQSSLSSSAGATLRRQYSMKAPPMESIIEEVDISMDPGDSGSLNISHTQINIVEKKERPSISPLILPKRSPSPSQDERRNSWGRSNTSPSPISTTDAALFAKRETFRKQETSPAIILTTTSHEDNDGLCGEKSIFDLNPVTSGYGTGDDLMMSLNLGHSEAPMSQLTDLSSSTVYDPASQWPGSVDNAWNLDVGPLSSSAMGPLSGRPLSGRQSASPSNDNGYADNRMHLIPPLKSDNNSGVTNGLLEDPSSSLRIIRDSLSSCSSQIAPRSILTIVNGLTQIDALDVLIRGSETWLDVVERNANKIKEWGIDGYTYYLDLESGHEVALNDLVPKEKSNVYILPISVRSTWQVRLGKIVSAHQ